MATFAYRARDRVGQLRSGTMEADNRGAVLERLREQQLLILEVKERAAAGPKGLTLDLGSLTQPKVTGKDLALFCRQFSTMVNAGLPLLSCLNVLRQQSENSRLRLVTDEVVATLEEGETLAGSMSRHPKVFPSLMINMMEAGEVGGVLDEVLDRLAVHLEKEHDLNEKVRSAMTYPVAIGIISIISVVVLLVFVLPTFIKMLTDMNVPLPLPTKIIMGLSSAFSHFWYLLAAAAAGGFFGFKRYVGTPRGRRQADALLLKLPIIGELQRKMIVSRFSRTLGTLVKGGVPILQALEVVKKTSGNVIVMEGVEKAQISIREGQGMAGPLAASGVFPPMVTQMIAVGEETGALDRLLEKISVFYDQEVDNIVSRLSSLIEPVLIVGMGLSVGFIVISILLPMFSIVGGVK